MLLCVKNRLLSGDLVANLKLLQHYPEINIEYLLRVAQDISPGTSSLHLSLLYKVFANLLKYIFFLDIARLSK